MLYDPTQVTFPVGRGLLQLCRLGLVAGGCPPVSFINKHDPPKVIGHFNFNPRPQRTWGKQAPVAAVLQLKPAGREQPYWILRGIICVDNPMHLGELIELRVQALTGRGHYVGWRPGTNLVGVREHRHFAQQLAP